MLLFFYGAMFGFFLQKDLLVLFFKIATSLVNIIEKQLAHENN